VAEVEVEGRVGADETACLGQRDPGPAEQHEALVLPQDPLRLGVVGSGHGRSSPEPAARHKARPAPIDGARDGR
jgi:hypothetical protein